MKIRHFVFAAAFAALALVGCEKPVDLGEAKLEIAGAPEKIEFAAEGGEQTIQLISTVDWALRGYTEEVSTWLSISPISGKAAAGEQTITIKANANDGKDRSVAIIFFGDVLRQAELTIKQAGSVASGNGTLESPYNAAEANAVASALASGAETESEVYVKGKVCEVKECSPQYGNATFYITDDGQVSADKFYVFQVKYLGGQKISAEDQIKVGDDVTIKAKLTNYKGNTPETSKGGVIVEHNGNTEGDETQIDYQNAPAKTVQEFITAGDTKTYYKLTGEVVEFDSQYFSFDLKDESGKIYVYSVADKDDWSGKVADGDIVTLAGKYLWYEHKTDANKNKHEVVDAYILEVKKGDQGGDTPAEPAEQPKLTQISIKEFLEKPANDTDWYELSGEIISIASASYGNFTIKDETGEVYIYGMTSKWNGGANDKSFASLGLNISDKVTLGTLRGEFEGTAQGGGKTYAAFYINHIAGEGQSFPAGTVTLTFPDDNKEAVSAYDKTWTAKIDASEFSITAFNNNKWDGWTFIKCGRKANDSVASIATKTAMPRLSKVMMTVDANNCPESVNSVVLNIYDDAAMTSAIVEGIAVDGGFGTGEKSFIVPADKQAENLYYEIVFDLKKDQRSSPKNGLIQISKVVYVAAE